MLTVTAPAPTPGAVRPQTRYSYTLTNGEYQLTGVSQCRTASSCAGTADEVKTSLAYDPNGNLYWTASGSGDGTGALVASITIAYDPIGKLATVDGPLPGAADTARVRYNSARQVIGTVSPDPDGAGPLKHRAVRNTYDSSTGLPTKVEQGNVNGQSDAEWAAFAAAQAVETVYDGNARPVVTKLTSGSTVHSLAQTSYDALGRPECSAQRMNPAAFASLPASACSLGTEGGDGPDRITKAIYDAAGRVAQVQTAIGTADAANEATATYTANGHVHTVTDGENNKTSYEYDGHDRLAKTYFPLPTKGAGASNAADYEETVRDPSGNVTSFRNRANESISFTYDALDRMTYKNLPGSEPDATYTYDLLGRMTGASRSGYALGFTYDALGRRLTESGPHGTVTSAWDIAGRRTRITHPDGYFVDQDHLVTGEIWKIRENGAASGIGVLATFGYDDLGRRSSLARGNGTVTTYGYDSASRLASLGHDLGGTAYDLTLGFAYNPAGQIVSNSRSNDAYAWLGHGSGSTGSSANGLNQISLHGGAAPTYDAKGNFASDPTIGKSYGYSSENLLISVGLGGATGAMAYDPLMRLSEAGVNQKTKPVHDGGQRIFEYYGASNTPAARFVNGPGLDEPLVEYEGSGLSTRRWLHSDERGSIVARSDDAGNLANVNTFDEQGLIGPTNRGRFHFAGQPYETLPDLYNSRARMRNPRLGRFNQTDPIGYGDGMNMYAYVGGDPVNFGDPLGLCKDGAGKTVGAPTGSRICDGHGRASGYGGIAGHLSGSTTAGPGGAGGPTFGEAYAAAQDLVGGYGSAAVNAAADYLMGSASLGRVAVSILYDRASLAQADGRGYLDMFRLGTDATVDTLRGILKDADVRAAMIRTFDRSYAEQREWGFWIGQRGNDYFAYEAKPGNGALIRLFEFRPPGSNIGFHTHPFLSLPQGLSGRDLQKAHRNGVLLMSLSAYGMDWADYRR